VTSTPVITCVVRVGGELHVEGRPEAAVAHLHHRRFGVTRADAGLVLFVFLLFRFRCGYPFQCRFHAVAAFFGGTLTSGLLAAIGRRRVGFQLGLQRFDLSFGVGQTFFERRFAAEGRGPGAGPHPHAVLGDAVHVDQFLFQQRRHASGQHAVEPLGVLRAEVGKRVIIHRDSAADPLERNLALLVATAIEFPRAADAPQSRVQPQRRQNPRVDGRASRLADDRLDALQQRRNIQPLDELPHHARLMVVRQQIVPSTGPEFDLPTIRPPQPRRPRRQDLRRRDLIRPKLADVKQRRPLPIRGVRHRFRARRLILHDNVLPNQFPTPRSIGVA